MASQLPSLSWIAANLYTPPNTGALEAVIIRSPTPKLSTLAPCIIISWTVIANAQLESGKHSDIETQTTFDNSFRGLPYKRREVTKEDFEKLRTHCWNQHEAPGLDNVEMVFMVADTQDNRSVVGIFALDVMDNIYLLDAKEVQHLLLNEDERKKINDLRKLEA